MLLLTTVMLLAGTLPRLQLEGRGERFRLPTSTKEDEAPALAEETIETTPLNLGLNMPYLDVFVRFAVPIVFIVSIITKEGRRRMLEGMWIGLAVVIGAYYATYIVDIFRGIIEGWHASALAANRDAPILELLVNAPTSVIVGISLLVAVLICAGGWWLWRQLFQRRRQRLVLTEARIALKELETGTELRDVIMHCYSAMQDAVREKRGITRDANETPREFELALTDIGLPAPDVTRLTRLFEQMRYGGQHIGSAGREEAQQCLQSIIDACEAQL